MVRASSSTPTVPRGAAAGELPAVADAPVAVSGVDKSADVLTATASNVTNNNSSGKNSGKNSKTASSSSSSANSSEISPFVISLTSSRRRPPTRHHILPPLSNSDLLRKSGRSHRTPAHLSHFHHYRNVKASAPSSSHPRLHSATKRSHSASGHESSAPSTAIDSIPSSPSRRGADPRRRTKTSTVTSSSWSSSPDKLPRRQVVNKIETVRVLRARPAFYPLVKVSAVGPSSTSAIQKSRSSHHHHHRHHQQQQHHHYPHHLHNHRANLASAASVLAASSSRPINISSGSSGVAAQGADIQDDDDDASSNSVTGKAIVLKSDPRSELSKRKRRSSAAKTPTPTTINL